MLAHIVHVYSITCIHVNVQLDTVFVPRCLETELSVVNHEIDQLLSTFSSSVVVFENKSFLASLSVKQV